MSKVSARARRQLIEAIRDRYLANSATEKRRILDEFVLLTGYHRKHAIRVLRTQLREPVSRAPRARIYDETVRDALVVVWEASNRICGKRLKALLPVLVPALEKHGHLSLDDRVRGRLLAASASTLDRLLANARAAAPDHRPKSRAPSRASPSSPARAVPDGKPAEPGYLEAELVAHSGDGAAGRCAYTLVLTDIATGWTECVALRRRDGAVIVEALERLRRTMPVPIRGIASTDGSGLVDDTVRGYCGEHQIELTRSWPRRRADRAGSTQKASALVRRLVGHGRLAGPRAVEALERLYAAAGRFVNFFQPSFKRSKHERAGAPSRKRYRAPQTPCTRLLASALVDETAKAALRAVLATLDPLHEIDEISAARQHLAELSTGEAPPVGPRRGEGFDRLLRSLAATWKRRKLRPDDRAGPRPPRHWRTRVDPFDGVWPQVAAWLEAEPGRTAKELLQRLRDQGLGEFSDSHLRTLQRRVKAWRRAIKPPGAS